jgi:hypothetical protein
MYLWVNGEKVTVQPQQQNTYYNPNFQQQYYQPVDPYEVPPQPYPQYGYEQQYQQYNGYPQQGFNYNPYNPALQMIQQEQMYQQQHAPQPYPQYDYQQQYQAPYPQYGYQQPQVQYDPYPQPIQQPYTGEPVDPVNTSIYNPTTPTCNPTMMSYNNNRNYYGQPTQYGYGNPIAEKKRQEEFQRQIEQQRRGHIEYMKQISKCAHTFAGEEITDDELEAIYNPDFTRKTPKEIEEEREFAKVAHIVECSKVVDNQEQINKIRHHNNVKAYHDKFIDPNADLNTFLQQAGNLYIDMLLRQEKSRRRKGVVNTYDKRTFMNSILNEQQFPNRFANVEDNVVHLPDFIKNKLESTYDERRAIFEEKIRNMKRRDE